MESKKTGFRAGTLGGLRVFSLRGLGRSSLFAATAAPFFAVRSPGAALLFVLLPAYAVLLRGDFSPSSKVEPAAEASNAAVAPVEILARFAAVFLACAASLAASSAGLLLARRFLLQTFPAPWGLGAAGAAASLALAAVHLPFLAAGGRTMGKAAAGTVFAAAGVLAAASALRPGSLYAAFLWILYSGSAPRIFLPLLAASVFLATLSAAVSAGIAQERAGRPKRRKEGNA